MDRVNLSCIDEELDSLEVKALCFLCLDVVNKKRLETVRDAKALFLRLEERGLLENGVFLSQLLQTIRRPDLLRFLETDSRRLEETDASPALSLYRVMLYNLHDDMTEENLDRMKFLLGNTIGRRDLEASKTALDLFVEMEKVGELSNTNLHKLHEVLQMFDQQLAQTVQNHMNQLNQPEELRAPPHFSMDNQRDVNRSQPSPGPSLSITETEPISEGETIFTDSEPNEQPSSQTDEMDYYILKHNPRGLCVVINNEIFQTQLQTKQLRNRAGTQEDAKALLSVFTLLGFKVVILDNLTSAAMRGKLNDLGKKNFIDHDALVVCVLSHGDKGSVFGVDGVEVSLRELTAPFTSKRASTLAGKPKLFFIQACQGNDYQGGSLPCPPTPTQEDALVTKFLEEDAGPIRGETVPNDADFLVGMATVPECKSFRHTATGSIYIQELCSQLKRSAESSANDDILTVLTRVNRNVSRNEYLNFKQMPEPKYTLTRKLVLKYV